MNEPKRHHYLPKLYLDYFTDSNNKLWVYYFQSKKIIEQTPINTAVESYRYSLKTDEGKKDNSIEKFLSNIESEAKPVLDKINQGHLIDLNEKTVLAKFVSIQKLRVPEYEKTYDEIGDKLFKQLNKSTFSSLEQTKLIMEKLEKENGLKYDFTAEEVYLQAQNEEISIKFHREYYLTTMIKLWDQEWKILTNMNWMFMYAPQDTSFITSDNPFIIIPPKNQTKYSGVGMLTENSLKLIPLTSKVMLMLLDFGNGIEKDNINKKLVRKFNSNIAIRFDNLLISNSKSQLEFLVNRLRIKELQKGPRVLVN